MLKRDVYEKLKEWKGRQGRKGCLLVRGARQVGKTYIIRYFGEQEYSHYIEVNFIKQAGLKKIFSADLDIRTLLLNFSLYMPEAVFEEGRTLLFLDEIQECPEAITSLKFWREDGRFDVIASGSMLGIDYKRPLSFPVGSVEYVDMTSLSFGEFLLANGISEDVISYLRACFEKNEKVSDPVNDKMMELLRRYLVIGGMPDVVNTYIETGSVAEADKVQKRILNDYRYDIAHYARADIKIKAEACYFSLPAQLGKENHKFQYSVVEKGSNARKYESSVEWLRQADIVLKVCNVSPLFSPLGAHKDDSDFRLYPTDIGLLTGMMDYFVKAGIIEDSEAGLAPDTKGALYEALVAEMLYKAGQKALYFTRNKQGTFEIEFVIDTESGLLPIEVKSGKSRSRSLDNLLAKDEILYGYKLTAGNVGKSGKKNTMPLYMAMFI